MLLENNMNKTTLFNAMIMAFALLAALTCTPTLAQEKAIPQDLQSALAGIARDRLVSEIEKMREISGEVSYRTEQKLFGGWLGKQLNKVTYVSNTLTWKVKPDSPRQKLVLNITKATWESVPRMNNQWRLNFHVEATIPCSGNARGSTSLLPGSGSSNFFGNLNVKADLKITVTQSGTGIDYATKVDKVSITQSGFAFTNEIAKLANSKLRNGVQESINTMQPKVEALFNNSLQDLSKNNSGSIRNLVGISASNSTTPPILVTPFAFALPGTWKSGNQTLAIAADGRMTLYVTNGGQRSYNYTYNKETGVIVAKDARGEVTNISLQWIDKNSFRWTSPNTTRVYQRGR